jgi:hypothetical protein
MVKNHPDNGGDVAACQEITAEYKKLFDMFKAGQTPDEEQKNNTTTKTDEALRNVINNIVSFDGVNIEVVGSWIWVDGNTFTYKEELKKLGFKWSKNRKKWHFSTEPSGKWHKKKMSFEDIQKNMEVKKLKLARLQESHK